MSKEIIGNEGTEIDESLHIVNNNNPISYDPNEIPSMVHENNSNVEEKKQASEDDKITKVEYTVLPHGEYSGDENFWNRNVIYIDDGGWVFLNNESTGINVHGRLYADKVRWEDLTTQQREALKGDKGDTGAQGLRGEKGEKGDTGSVEWDEDLTPEHLAELKGPQGDSAYEVWEKMPGNEGKTEADFIDYLSIRNIPIDANLDQLSENPVQNKVITNEINSLKERIAELENRLKYTIGEDIYTFKFGVTDMKKYGYIKDNSSAVTPFEGQDPIVTYSPIIQNINKAHLESLEGRTVTDIVMNSTAGKLTTWNLKDASLRKNGESATAPSSKDDDPTLQNVVFSEEGSFDGMNLNQFSPIESVLFDDGKFQGLLNTVTRGIDFEEHYMINKGEERYEGFFILPGGDIMQGGMTYIDVHCGSVPATVYLGNVNHADSYVSTVSYSVGNKVYYNKLVWRCTKVTTGDFNPECWEVIVPTHTDDFGGRSNYTVINLQANETKTINFRSGLNIGIAMMIDDRNQRVQIRKIYMKGE